MARPELIILVTSLSLVLSACPDSSWTSLDGRCYKTSDSPMSWFTSQQVSLFSILDTSNYHYIGLTDLAYEGIWIWQHSYDLQFSYFNWKGDNPDNSYNGEDCVHLDLVTLKWNDVDCETTNINGIPFYALCEADDI